MLILWHAFFFETIFERASQKETKMSHFRKMEIVGLSDCPDSHQQRVEMFSFSKPVVTRTRKNNVRNCFVRNQAKQTRNHNNQTNYWINMDRLGKSFGSFSLVLTRWIRPGSEQKQLNLRKHTRRTCYV